MSEQNLNEGFEVSIGSAERGSPESNPGEEFAHGGPKTPDAPPAARAWFEAVTGAIKNMENNAERLAPQLRRLPGPALRAQARSRVEGILTCEYAWVAYGQACGPSSGCCGVLAETECLAFRKAMGDTGFEAATRDIVDHHHSCLREVEASLRTPCAKCGELPKTLFHEAHCPPHQSADPLPAQGIVVQLSEEEIRECHQVAEMRAESRHRLGLARQQDQVDETEQEDSGLGLHDSTQQGLSS
jgi:hypothetical protein